MRRITATILLLLYACSASATDYYVSSIRSGRSDSNAGTSINAPWATFGKVMQQWGIAIQPGDTIHLERGSVWDYSLSTDWRVPAGGSAAAGPITLRGDDYGSGALPMLRRSSGVAQAVCFWIRDPSYITLRDFVLDGGSVQGVNSVAVLIGGSNQAGDVSHINILNLTIQNLACDSSYYVSGIFVNAWNNHSVSDCLIAGNSVSGFNAHGLNHYPQKTTTKNQSLHNRITWRNNHVFGAATHYGNVGAGIHIAFGGSDNVFEYNQIDGNEFVASCFLMNCANDETNLTIRYNVFKDNASQCGMIFDLDGNGATGCTLQADVYGNIFTGSYYAGLWMYVAGYYSGTVNIYNNTFYDNNKAGTTSWQNGGEIQVDPTSSAVKLNIRNNLLVAAEPNTTCIYIRDGYTGALTHDHNLYWNTSGSSAAAIYNNGTTYTVGNVKSYEATAQNTDPHFTNPVQTPTSVSDTAGASPNGFMPLTGSPAIDTGASLAPSYAKDINGLTRPQGLVWDIGAYEVAGQTPVPLSAPSALTTAPLSSSAILLTWRDNSTDEAGFEVQRSDDGAIFTNVATLVANTTNWTNNGLTPARTYYYRMRSVDGLVSAYTSVAQATTPAVVDTTPPTLISAAAVGDPTRVILVFNKPISPAAATTTNFGIPGFIGVMRAACTQNVVTLSVAPAFSDQTTYTISARNVRGLATNAIATNTQINFTYRAIDSALMAWLTFESDTTDRSGHGNNATASGVSIVASGRSGQALQFTSTGSYLQVPLVGMTATRGTVALWQKAYAFPDAPQYIFGHSTQGAWGSRIQIYTDTSTGQLNLGLGMDHATRLNLDTLVTQQWYHVALTWDGTNYVFYGNGTSRGSGSYTGLAALATFADIGNDGLSTSRISGFNGLIDDVRIYNRPLTAAEVALLATTVTVPTPPINVRIAP